MLLYNYRQFTTGAWSPEAFFLKNTLGALGYFFIWARRQETNQ